MSRTQEGRRQQHGYVTRSVEVPAELDRRLVHHCRRFPAIAYEALMIRALEAECARRDLDEQVRSSPE